MGWSISLQRLGQKQHQRSMLVVQGSGSRSRAQNERRSDGMYFPVTVVDEKKLSRSGVGVVMQMRRVALGRSAGVCIHLSDCAGKFHLF